MIHVSTPSTAGTDAVRPAGNPFATRYVRPAAMEYVGLPPDLLDRLQRNGWWGEIVGPHGSGKSTLLATLVPLLAAAGRKVEKVELHAGQRAFPWNEVDAQAWNNETQVVIDGYEQLGWWSRVRLNRACRRAGAGLLVTAHASAGLPLLFRTAVTAAMFAAVVSRLLPDDQIITADDIARCHARHGDNAREALFALYDLYEQRK